MNKFEESNAGKQPSLIVAIICVLIYLFGAFPIAYAVAYGLKIANFSTNEISLILSYVPSIVLLILVSALTYFLIKRYSTYLFSYHLKSRFVNHLIVGIKWSIPLIIFHGIILSIPGVREKIIETHMKETLLFDSSVIKLILFSARGLISAIFEELICRGIIQQKLEKLFTPTSSVFLAAGVFSLAHCVYYDMLSSTVLSAFLLGILSGFAFKQTRSCISAFIPHMINNVESIIIMSIIFY